METANYDICVAANVSDVKLTATIRVFGSEAPNPYGALPSYESGKIMNVSDAEFEAVLGRPIPDGSWSGDLQANDAICQLSYAKTGIARWIGNLLTKMKNDSEAKGTPDLNILFIYNMPFRALAKMAGGFMDMKMVDDILLLVNGHFWRGFGRLIVDFFKNMARNGDFNKTLENGPEA